MSKGSNARSGGDSGDFVALSSTDVPYGNLQELYGQLLERYRKVVEEKDHMSSDSKNRLERHLQKELDFRDKLGELKGRIASSGEEDPKGDVRMSHIRGMHGEIQDTIGQIQNKTSKILHDQERDLIRAFRARLADVTDELERERKKNESGSVEWVQRCRKLTEELEWLRDLTEKLTGENKNFLKENKRFKRQLKTQEEDREFLIKQLVAVKKENARLRYSFEQAGVGGMALPFSNTATEQNIKRASKGSNGTSSRPRSASSVASNGSRSGKRRLFPANTAPMTQDAADRYENIINKLQRNLEQEQQKQRMVKNAHENQSLNTTDELRGVLGKCIDDVKQDIAQRNSKRRSAVRRGKSVGRSGTLGRFGTDPAQIELEEFTPSDRINVMEWLLSQDRIIYMLYDHLQPRMATPV